MSVVQLGPNVLAAAAIAAGAVLPHSQNPTVVSPEPRETRLPAIVVNDNRHPAGTRANGVLTLDLRLSEGLWRPEGDAGPALRIEAFGEGSEPRSAPGPRRRRGCRYPDPR